MVYITIVRRNNSGIYTKVFNRVQIPNIICIVNVFACLVQLVRDKYKICHLPIGQEIYYIFIIVYADTQ